MTEEERWAIKMEEHRETNQDELIKITKYGRLMKEEGNTVKKFLKSMIQFKVTKTKRMDYD